MKEVKAFITRDDFILSDNASVSALYELSNIAATYSKNRQQYTYSLNALYSLYVFKAIEVDTLTQQQVDDIVFVVNRFTEFLTTSQVTNKAQAIILFMNEFNLLNTTNPITDFSYNTIVSLNLIKSPDYVTFKRGDITCSVWVSDPVFQAFYPHYDVNIILPFDNFASLVNRTTDFISALGSFNLIDFNTRVEADKNGFPTTYTRILNIPYKVPNGTVLKDCFFAFNIYGLQGNYDYILKLELYNYLTSTLNLDPAFVESVFPTILNINEFFITPRWDKVAIPSQVGQTGINSQISKTFSEVYDLDKFVKVYSNESYLRDNTYNVPFDYNNILLQITNGYYTEPSVKDFKSYYSDFIAISSTHPDFARMSQKTQKFIILLENMINVGDSNNATELFNKVLTNTNYHFTIINRAGVDYLSYSYLAHQYYLIPKYQFNANNI